MESVSADSKPTQAAPVGPPNNLDFEPYLANYTSRGKVDRLTFISQRCPSLTIDALALAAKELRHGGGFDTARYKSTVRALANAQKAAASSSASGSMASPLAEVDDEWVKTADAEINTRRVNLEHELRDAKANLLRDKTRIAYMSIGEHLYLCGDLASSLKMYTRARDYWILLEVSTLLTAVPLTNCSSSPKDIIGVCLKVAKISIEARKYSVAQTYIIKAEASLEKNDADNVEIRGKLNCYSALVYLDSAKYKQASRAFLDVAFDLQNTNELVSMNDITTYAVLCAMATFSRSDLKEKFVDNTDFKQFLELEPDIRELFISFYNSKYTNCLSILDKLTNDFQLDIYLHTHFAALHHQIRTKALMQYFGPFLSVDLHRMAASFNTSVKDLEQELAQLITDKQISARIDSQNKVLRARYSDKRADTFATSIEMGSEYEEAVRDVLLRTSLLNSGMIVSGSGKEARAREGTPASAFVSDRRPTRPSETYLDEADGELLCASMV